jgi:hypothetical protein
MGDKKQGVVYVCQQPFRFVDLSDSLRYGRLEYLLPPGDITAATAPIVRKMKVDLKDYSDDDYILAMGAPAAIAIVGAIAARVNHGNIKILTWDKKESRYYAIDVKI